MVLGREVGDHFADGVESESHGALRKLEVLGWEQPGMG